MSRSEQEIREHILAIVKEHVSRSDERRKEALRDYFLLTLPNMTSEELTSVTDAVPPLLPELYEKWIGMFTDRLFETISRDQIEELCNGSSKNNAALVLVYIMFMESERMEGQIARDLREYGLTYSGENNIENAVGDFIRAKMVQLSHQLKKNDS